MQKRHTKGIKFDSKWSRFIQNKLKTTKLSINKLVKKKTHTHKKKTLAIARSVLLIPLMAVMPLLETVFL